MTNVIVRVHPVHLMNVDCIYVRHFPVSDTSIPCLTHKRRW